MGGMRARVGIVAAVVAVAALGLPYAEGAPTAVDGTPLCGVAAPAGSVKFRGRSQKLKVATFNVLHSETDEGDESLGARLPLAAQNIVAADVDVVGMQEVTFNETFDPAAEYPQKHGFVAKRLAEELAARTGHQWEYCWSQSNPHVPLTPDVDEGGGNPLDDQAASRANFPEAGDFREGLAIVSRLDIVATKFRRMLPRSYEAAACTDGDPFCNLAAAMDSRQVLWANIQRPDLTRFDFFTTHIAHGLTALSDTTKLLQVHQAIDLMREWSTPDAWPDFLAGDFNSSYDTDRYETLVANGFVDTYLAGGGTECVAPGDASCSGGPVGDSESYTAGPTRTMSSRIDYVWALPPAGCDLHASAADTVGHTPAQMPDGRWLWASDHLGMRATIGC